MTDSEFPGFLSLKKLLTVLVVLATGLALAAAYSWAFYLLLAIKVADQWEKVAVLRLGRYIGLRGPGRFLIVPIADRLSRRVDQRVRVASVTAESTLTRDRSTSTQYEATKERGSMVIVPSPAVETMGLGGMLGTASVAGNKS